MGLFRYIIAFYPRCFCLKLNYIVFYQMGLLVLIINHTLAAQDIANLGHAQIKSWLRSDYNAQRQNWSVAQHPVNGLMYFANSKGLLEYDGAHWKLYQSQQVLRSVCISKKGRIYTGALGEIGYWHNNTQGELVYQSLKNLIKDKQFAQEAIWNILETQWGVLFQSFAYAYLLEKNGKIKTLKLPSNIYYFSEINGELYVPGIGSGIYKYEGSNFKELPGTYAFLKDKIVSSLSAIGNKLLVGTAKAAYIYDNGQFIPFGVELNKLLGQFQLNKIQKLPNDQYAFGTIVKGIIISDAKGKVLQELNTTHGLPNNTVLALATDNEGNIWTGLDNGISMININQPIKYYHDAEGTLGAIYDAALFQNILYLGTNHGLFAKNLTESKAKFTLVPNTQGQVWRLDIIDDQLICGHNNGTYDITQKGAQPMCSITGGWALKKLQSKPDLLLQGTYTKVLVYKKNNIGLWTFGNELQGQSEAVNQIEEDSEGNVWLNQVNGVIKQIKLTTDGSKISDSKIFKLPSYKYNMSFVNDTLWLHSPYVVAYYNKLRQNFNLIKPNEKPILKLFPGITQKPVAINIQGEVGILENNNTWQNLLWFENRHFVEGAENIKELDQNQIIFCLEDGYIIAPKQVFLTKYQKKVRPKIRAVLVEGKTAPYLVADSLNQKTIELAATNNTLEIQFAPDTYSVPATYSYYLEGYSSEWSAWQRASSKWFYNLSSGNYTFKVKTNTSTEIASVNFTILAPWYWNSLSKIFYLIMAGFFGWALYKIHLNNLKKQQAKLQEKHQKEVDKQQQQIVKLRNEQLEADVIRKSEELANSTIALLKRNELLGQLKDQISRHTIQSENQSGLQKLIHTIDKNISHSEDWKLFETNFNQVHESFLKKLSQQFPMLSHGDLRLAAYLRMNLSTKEIAQLLNITARSVELKRYRLRSKMNLDTHENLNDYMMRV